MTEQEAFEEIIKRPKFYAGLRGRNGQFYTAQAASHIKQRYKAGTLSNEIIAYIISMSGFLKIKEAEYIDTNKPTFSSK